MTKFIDYQAPAMDKKKGLVYETKRGKIAHLFFGAEQVKCVLQYMTDHEGKPHLEALVHYASGQIIAPLANRKLMLYVANPYSRFSDRAIAEMAITDIIAQRSPDELRAIFNKAPVVNTTFKR